jgi:ketosteroid isomerase-like protein
MSQNSPELEQLARDAHAAFLAEDHAFYERHEARSDPALLIIGTDANEWSAGADAVKRSHDAAQTDDRSGMQFSQDTIQSYEEGDVGWTYIRGRIERDGRSVVVRGTSILHRENGVWKLIHSHTSIGVPNDQIFHTILQADSAPN